MIIKIKVSHWLAAVLVGMHAGAAVILWPLDLFPWLKVLLAVLVVLSLGHAAAYHVWRVAPKAIHGLRWEQGSGLYVRFSGDDRWRPAAVTNRFIHPWLVLLTVRPAEGFLPRTVALARDAIDAEVFRRLRAALLAPPRSQEG